MTTPVADQQQIADLSWGPESYEDALAWRQGRWPHRAVLMPTKAVNELYALIDSPQSRIAKKQKDVEERRDKFLAYLKRGETTRGKAIGRATRLLTIAAASAFVFASPVLAPSVALGATIGWSAGWLIANFAAFKSWRTTDNERVKQATDEKRKRLRVPLRKYHGKEKLFFWTPRFGRIFWWTFLLATSPPGFAYEMLRGFLNDEGLRSRKHKLIRAQKNVENEEKSRRKSVEAIIKRDHVGLAVEVPANEQPSVDAYERAYDRINPPPAGVGPPSTGRERGRGRRSPDEDTQGLT